MKRQKKVATKARAKTKPGVKAPKKTANKSSKSASSAPKVVDFSKTPTLTPFTLKSKLVKLGSYTQTVAETPSLALYLRIYAPHEGVNAMHTRPFMDHAFTVLQGKARFYSPRGEKWEVGRNEGILVPSGAYYCVENSGDDVLVILCSASLARHKGDPAIRLSIKGTHIDSHSPENLRRSDYVYSDAYFE
jgi:mannose-6-phosphate isomerase-like protein (cupin superfamily)